MSKVWLLLPFLGQGGVTELCVCVFRPHLCSLPKGDQDGFQELGVYGQCGKPPYVLTLTQKTEGFFFFLPCPEWNQGLGFFTGL